MRYDAAHKARSRAAILEAARLLFRRDGFEGASIHQVMKQAGLTHGAFYAHFENKRALVHAVLGIEAGLVAALKEASTPVEAVAALAHYLDPSQREDVARGCPLVSHPVDAIRGDLRSGYGRQYRDFVQALEPHTADVDDARTAALLTIAAALVGAAIDDAEEADRLAELALIKVHDLVSEKR